ncbi:MAG: aldehyde dehydrogenase family protein [Woeseiaceae bacterium]|nr:aldehyde dehydrogenase family protein [Woeseiaceae bacterium]
MKKSIPDFATVDPFGGMTANAPGKAQNLCDGRWQDAPQVRDDIPDPLHGGHFLDIPDTTELAPFARGLAACPKTGLHNPYKNTERYVHLGRVCARAAARMAEPDVEAYFAKLTQRVMPKSTAQCTAEVVVTRVFIENFAGDGVRFLARGFSNPGDRTGQESRGYRWPWGPVVVVAPFNFPLEIPALQTMGALFMGNRPLVKVDSKVSIVFEQFLRLLIDCGLDPNDIDFVHCRGERMGEFISANAGVIRMAQFTGSSGVAERVSAALNGRVRLEDAGFDWKILGPDFDGGWLDYVAWQADEDAYNAAGQKCSAQSALFVHDNWAEALLPKLGELAARRSLDDLTIGPVLTWNNEQIRAHIDAVMKIDGAELLFGGQPLSDHSIPDCYGAWQPTAVRLPLAALTSDDFDLATKELFGPFQIVVTYGDGEIDDVLGLFERMSHHLTAAVVSANPEFQQAVLGRTVNGTTYCGMRARTTGAPQNHWFGPSGDPRAAGIGTPEAIVTTWSGHREIIFDQGALDKGWTIPPLG